MRIAVVGAGIVGLAVTYELARAGHEVECFEAQAPMAARSCGDSRIFRLAHERPELVSWAAEAHRAWREWSEVAGVRLVGDEGLVVSGDVDGVARAMAEAGARFDVTDVPPALPVGRPIGPFLRDPMGGVVRAALTGDFLVAAVGDRLVERRVTAIRLDGDGDGDGAVVTADSLGERRYESVVVVAGAGTPDLVEPLGIAVPDRLVHHVRFTFPLRDAGARPPCWLDRSHAWRAGFTSYGQLAAPGRWAVGGELTEADTAWSVSADDAADRARQALTAYVREHVTGCEPDVVDTIYCNVTDGLDDGVSTARAGAVLAVWGTNLFKFAPVLGRELAEAATSFTLSAALAAASHVP